MVRFGRVDAARYEQLAMRERWVRRLMSVATQLVEEEPARRRRLSRRRLRLEKWGEERMTRRVGELDT
jgi:hypothetical protein